MTAEARAVEIMAEKHGVRAYRCPGCDHFAGVALPWLFVPRAGAALARAGRESLPELFCGAGCLPEGWQPVVTFTGAP